MKIDITLDKSDLLKTVKNKEDVTVWDLKLDSDLLYTASLITYRSPKGKVRVIKDRHGVQACGK